MIHIVDWEEIVQKKIQTMLSKRGKEGKNKIVFKRGEKGTEHCSVLSNEPLFCSINMLDLN